jgi:hypothetical protein
MKWVRLGIQWDCALGDDCGSYIGAPSEAGHGDTFENGHRSLRVIAAARRHHKRTGHPVNIEVHNRATIGRVERVS